MKLDDRWAGFSKLSKSDLRYVTQGGIWYQRGYSVPEGFPVYRSKHDVRYIAVLLSPSHMIYGYVSEPDNLPNYVSDEPPQQPYLLTTEEEEALKGWF